MEQSIFMDPGHTPGKEELEKALGNLYPSWQGIQAYVWEYCPAAVEEWNYSKLGWNCRIKDKKRVIIYLMPGHRVYRASFVLGAKAVAVAKHSDLSDDIKAIIASAKIHAEGAGVRIIVDNKKTAGQILKLAAIKIGS